MQMARIFDMASLSSNIRHYGSATEKGYLEDTIQLEIKGPLLDDHARFRRGLPFGQVLVDLQAAL
jgi:hypothetical protein